MIMEIRRRVGIFKNSFGKERVSTKKEQHLRESASTAPTCTATMVPLEPCALNAEIQHFILRFNKIS
jgi:hypothetical protein